MSTVTKARKPSQIPEFKDEAEAAAFWDTHSPEDFTEEFEDVQVRFAKPLVKRGLTVKLSDETIEQLRKIAEAQGIGPTTLVRMWVLERLRERREKSA